MSEWISVKERLPEALEYVLVHYENGLICIDWRERTWGFILEGCEDGRGNVTHWMPLPEPPEED